MQIKIVSLILLCVAISACEKTKEILGLTRETPDEFQAVEHPPLEIPPEFTLRPPQPGSPRPQEITHPKTLEQKLFKRSPASNQSDEVAPPIFKATPSQPRSKATRQVLYEAGTQIRQPDIKEVVNREAYEADMGSSEEKPATFMQSLSSWEKKKEDPK